MWSTPPHAMLFTANWLVLGACSLDRGGEVGSPGPSLGGQSVGGGGASTTVATTTGGASTTGPGGGGTGAEGGRGPCNPHAEDCQNGVDDDCDGDTDCADEECGDFLCVPSPTDGTLVRKQNEAMACPSTLVGLTRESCVGCGCNVVSAGTCSHRAALYDNTACQGPPAVELDINANGCTAINVNALANQTVCAVGRPLPLQNSACNAPVIEAPSETIFLCALPSAGSCEAGGDVCVPADAALSCALFDGNVSCPTPYNQKELLYDRAGQCDCTCLGGPQACPTNKHYHAHRAGGCIDPKTDVGGDMMPADTEFTTINSLANHDATIAASDTVCNNVSPLTTAATTYTLCCVPDF